MEGGPDPPGDLMALDENIRILSGVAFFEDFAQDQLRLLAFGAERTSLPPGGLLFREGAKADSAFILLSGTIRLLGEEEGESREMGAVRPGALLGAFALITDTRRPTSAIAETECRLLRIERRDFRRVLEEYPALAVALHKRMTEEFQAMVEKIGRLAPRFS